MSDIAQLIRGLLRPKFKIDRNWYMEPIAALIHEEILLILFGWEFEGQTRYALNFRDASDDDMQLAWEIVRPMKLMPSKVEKAKSEAESSDPEGDGFQEALICNLLESFDVLGHFADCGVEAPAQLRNLILGANALMEGEEIAQASLTAKDVQARVARRM